MTAMSAHRRPTSCPQCDELVRQTEELRLSLAELRSAVEGRAPERAPEAERPDDLLLTEREWQVLALIAQGRSNSEIAAEVFLSVNTVKTHVKNAFRKIGVNNRTEAAVWVMRPAPEPVDLTDVRRPDPLVSRSLAG